MSDAVFLADDLAAAAPGVRVAMHGAEARHAVSVLRIRAGEQVQLVDGRGRRALGTVDAVRPPAEFDVLVREVVDEAQPQVRVVAVQALLKGEHGELALDQLTQCGVDEIVPWAAEHSVVSLRGERADKAASRWQAKVAAAAKQSRRARWPVLAAVCDTAEVVRRLAGATAVVLHEGASTSIAEVPMPSAGTVVLVVGPEGGISDAERAAFAAAGAHEARLGPTVLRGSLAGSVAAGIVLGSTNWRV